ncbi:MAG: ATPase [Rhodobacteraceae bacterium]|nr:ATPase [Paracoccaceae bacterium]
MTNQPSGRERNPVRAMQDGDQWIIERNGRPVRTPGDNALAVPTQRLALILTREWEAQSEPIKPANMPLTRLCNSAIDCSPKTRQSVVNDVAAYGATDLLCYRASAPAELVRRQEAGWDPIFEWARKNLGVSLRSTTGILPISQSRESLDRLKRMIASCNRFTLTGMAEIVTATGSVVLGLAYLHGKMPAEQIWKLSIIDENWQLEKWGFDHEAATALATRKSSFLDGCRLMDAIVSRQLA